MRYTLYESGGMVRSYEIMCAEVSVRCDDDERVI